MDQASHVSARLYREALLHDPNRPLYHFAIADGDGMPGDSNGAFFADGRYHLMYLYRSHADDTFNWGHISSRDLLHWRHHPDALRGEKGDEGAFSGGAFVDEDGAAYLTFWKFAARDGSDNSAIAIARSRPPYDTWERLYPLAVPAAEWGIASVNVDGQDVPVCCADPSNIWKKDGWYYMQTGNLCVLNKYGREENAPREYQGDWTDLFKSRDLIHWRYVHRFYHNPRMGADDWPDRTEDDMCPSFLPLYDQKSGGKPTGKYLQLFIAHNKGSQYYVGRLEGETFVPEMHGRFSWKDRMCFAPEALVDDQNRQIAWHWIMDGSEGDIGPAGWRGVYNFPRVLWLEGDTLKMAPAQELDRLQFRPQRFDIGTVRGETPLAIANGESFRLRASIRMGHARRAGFAVREDDETGERVEICVDRDRQALVMDVSSMPAAGQFAPVQEEAPFALGEDEELRLDLFVDRSVIEVYANERQAICRLVFPTRPHRALGVQALSDGAEYVSLDAWEMDASNPY